VLTWSVIQGSCLPATGWAQHGPHAAGQPSTATIGRPASPFQLKTLEGAVVNVGTFRGKPLIINFFASWCDPCREEMPLINELAAKGARNGYGVLGIAVEDGRAAVLRYATEAKLIFPVALDTSSAVKRAYRIFGPPATFFVDAEGTVRDAVIGPIDAERARLGLQRAGGPP
jgi:cytochrome c biogenesis protein CcmG/thiol:disulfide interchange protein DsbE